MLTNFTHENTTYISNGPEWQDLQGCCGIDGLLKFVGTYGGIIEHDNMFALSQPCILYLFIFFMLCIIHNVLLFDSYHHEFDYIQKKENRKFIEDIIPKLAKLKETLPEIAEDDEEYHKTHKVIAVNGYWYNVKHFIPYHPGGPIIEKFVGADVTSSFYGMHRHPDQILSERTPVAKVKLDENAIRNKEINADYWNLWHRYEELGYFVPSQLWLYRTLFCNTLIIVIAAYSIIHYPQEWFFNGVMVGTFIVQQGFLTHDGGHRLIHPDT